MNPIRRELLNGLLVLVVASLLSVAFSAFQVSFDVHLWVLILMGIAIAVSGYVVFEIALGYIASTEGRELALAESTQRREEEWLKRVGTPARFELGVGEVTTVEVVRAMKPGSDLTIMLYAGFGGGGTIVGNDAREQIFGTIVEHLKRGTIREYKRLLCYDHDVFVNDHELKSGILRVGEGLGTIDRLLGEHCRLMMETKGCSLFVAPAVLRHFVALFGTEKAAFSMETFDQGTGNRAIAGLMLFCDPPNGEIIEQFRQMERATERHMVAVHKIRFPEDPTATAQTASR